MKDTVIIYTDYQILCNNNGYKEMNASNFGNQLKQHIPKLDKKPYRNDFQKVKNRYLL